MNDRAPIRDRTLILRILVPGLEARLRDKMKELEESQQQASQQNKTPNSSRGNNGPNDNSHNNNSNNNSGSSSAGKESYLDLDGVTCEPTPARNRTLWNFHCDGATYPAKLVNLPCPIELHKTHDHAMYYKCVDVAQMLIVYEDDMALEEAEFVPMEGFPSYYHSGITPPLRRVVERRFAAREHRALPPPRASIVDVEAELTELMDNLSKDEKNKRKNKVPTLSSATKVLEEVVEEVVDYEPWMDDYGRSPQGVEFDADDQLCSLHPEVWLSPKDVREIRDESDRNRKEAEIAAAAASAASAASAAAASARGKKKEGKKDGTTTKKKKKDKLLPDGTATGPPAAAPVVKKGIANKKSRGIVDEAELDLDTSFLNDELDLEGADGDFLELVDAENFEDLGLDFDL